MTSSPGTTPFGGAGKAHRRFLQQASGILLATALIVVSSEPVAAGPAPLEPVARVEHDPALEVARSGFVPNAAYEPHRSSFSVRVGGVVVGHRILAVTALPGEAVAVRIESNDPAGSFLLRYASGQAQAGPATSWDWRAPDQPGIYPVRIESRSGDFVHLNVLVMHGRDRIAGEVLNGYAIGTYKAEPLRGDPVYLPPIGFVEATAANEDVLVSPHFTLGQFLCKQPGEPRYLALSVALVQKLEGVLEAVNAAGIETPSLHVMSGFRTPAYNAAIGNKTVYSRHLWGDAADIYVDVDRDQQIDDLNRDGRSDVADARVLYRIVEKLEQGNDPSVTDGGLGLYRRNAAHGAFIHVDARGHSTRW